MNAFYTDELANEIIECIKEEYRFFGEMGNNIYVIASMIAQSLLRLPKQKFKCDDVDDIDNMYNMELIQKMRCDCSFLFDPNMNSLKKAKRIKKCHRSFDTKDYKKLLYLIGIPLINNYDMQLFLRKCYITDAVGDYEVYNRELDELTANMDKLYILRFNIYREFFTMIQSKELASLIL